MGDISRHRDIFLFTRDGAPSPVLDGARISAPDLTYLELGNYLTDVSQFRDPVTYIFAKRRIWHGKVLPKTRDKVQAARWIAAAGAAAALAGSQLLKKLSGTTGDVAEGVALGLGALGALAAVLPSDTYADLGGADEWIDTLLGTPLERTPLPQTPGARTRRDEKHYGYLGLFFTRFIEGATHLLFADDVPQRTQGEWGRVEPIPANRLTEVYAEFFTQYYPHEHSDQPPYVWDASKRPSHPSLYGPSRRQRTLRDGDVGVMNAVDVHYVGYLAEELARVEDEWRASRRDDRAGRQRLLVRTGKLLHGVEDWFFHSNVVELLALRGFRPAQQEGETDEVFLERFVRDVARRRPEFVAADPGGRLQLQRRLYRRLRYPAYDAGTEEHSGGRLSTTRMSTPSLRHAYPAFPSSQDTTHTLLHALENLEHKLGSRVAGALPPWASAALGQLGVSPGTARRTSHDRLREWIPLIFTLLDESERQRLVADVEPQSWPLQPGAPRPPRTGEKSELDLQLERHVAALRPRQTESGRTENNYEQFIRYLGTSGHLNARGQQALRAAFEIDVKAEELPTDGPGCGGFLLTYAVELQALLDAGDAATAALNTRPESVHGKESDNGAFSEIVGSHSLMSKDTLTSVPFFDDARVLATVASSSVFTILLQQVAVPAADRRLSWEKVLHHLIRYPPSNGGWERRALAMFGERQRIPAYADLPELAQLVAQAMQPVPAPTATGATPRRSRRENLEERYLRLEGELSRYRYP